MRRRSALMLMAGTCAAPRAALASQPKAVAWDDLIPPGVPYSEIIGVGAIDEVNDTWNPVFDENGSKLNLALDGAYIRMPGYILPLEFDARGVTDFILVPYLGACIHVPPPPPNQLVFVTARHPWPSDSLWDAVWVTGHMRAEMRATDLADIGYALDAERIEAFEW